MENELGHSQINNKGQITVPKRVREILDVEEGSYIIFIEKDGEIIIRKGKIIYE